MLPFTFSNPTTTWIFLVACLIWNVPEWMGAFKQMAKTTRKEASIRDRGSMGVLIGLLWLGLVLALVLAVYLPAAAITWQPLLLFGIGIGLMLSGVALRWYAIWILGPYFTRDVAVSTDQKVVQTGPYRYIRHPAYSGTFLTMLGVSLALTNWAGMVVLLLCVFLGHLPRIRIEEQALIQSIGQPYLDYMRRTKRFLPGVL